MSRLLLIILGVFVAPAMTYASIYGILTGKVTDAEGKGIPGASVRVEGTTRGAYAKPDGSYTITNINAGTWNVRVSSVGYKDNVQRTTISADQTVTLNFKLVSDAVTTGTVVVEAKANAVDATRVGVQTNITSETLTNVPRETVGSVVLLTAGVLAEGGGFSIRGSRPNETQIRVDGLDVGDQFTGGLGGSNTNEFPMVSNFATEQVQVLTGSFGSEYGNAMGGIVNTVVKTGRTDRYEGLIRYRTDIGALYGKAGAGPGEGLKAMAPGLNSYDVNFGGPIPFLGSSTFFLAGRYDTREFRDNGIGVIDPYGNNLGALPDNSLWLKNLTGRMTFSITDEIRLQVGGMYGVTSRERSGWSWLYANELGSIPATANIQERVAKQAAIEQLVANAFGRVTHNISPTAFYEFTLSTNTNEYTSARRNSFEDPGLLSGFDFITPKDEYDVVNGQLRRGNKDLIVDQYTPLLVDNKPAKNPLTGFYEGGVDYTGSRNPYGIRRPGFFANHGNERVLEFRKSNYLQADGSFTSVFGNPSDLESFNHTIRAGFETRFFTLRRHYNTLPWDGNPFFDIYGEENIYAENPAVRSRTSAPYEPITGALYVQDQIRYKGIVINPGLRFDFIDPSARFRTNDDDFIPISSDNGFASTTMKFQVSPRLFIAYPISETANLNISYGVYFQMPQLSNLYDNFNTEILRGNQILGNPQLEAQRTNAYQVGYELQATEILYFSANAFYKDMYNQTGLRYVPAVPVPYSEYAVSEYGNSRGIEFTIRKAPTDHIGLNLNYTLSSTRGTASNPTSNYDLVILAAADPITGEKTFPLTEYYNDFDRRHRINAIVDFVWGRDEGPSIGGIHLLENTNINFTTVFQTGRPYTRRDRSGVQIGEFNGERYPSQLTVDMRFQRTIPLADIFGDWTQNSAIDLFVDVGNLLNSTGPLQFFERTGNADNDADQLDLRIGEFSSESWLENPNPNDPLQVNSQFDLFGNKLYNAAVDYNKDGVVTREERYEGYQQFVRDSQARRGNYQFPRTVAAGIMLRF